MKAMLCKAFGPPESLVLEEVAPKPLAAGQVRIAVHAAGVNFPDVLMVQGKYQFKPPFPFAPGAEVAGEVVETSPDVSSLARGDRVVAMIFAPSCRPRSIADVPTPPEAPCTSNTSPGWSAPRWTSAW